jgi:phosphoglycolate phosphatase-like HAD superfamily hydrolase
VAVDLDALCDSRALWRGWLESAARVLPVDPASLPDDRAAAAAVLDAAGAGNWRTLLERYAEDHTPVFVRPDAEVSAALRALAASGVVLGVFTDAPEELARVMLAHVGAARRLTALTAGAGARDRLVELLGQGARVAASRKDLLGVVS